MKIALLTNDVESTSLALNDLNKATAEKVFYEGMPKLLELYKKYDIKTTFFFTGEIIELFPEIVKLVIPYGHEVASHGYSHRPEEAFDLLSLEEQCNQLKKSKSLLEKYSNEEVISFRAPALRVNKDTPKALCRTGFLIDSSVASQRFDFFLTFGMNNKLKWLFAPRLPYFTSETDLTKKGNSKILEIPITALIFPYIGTTLRIFPKLTQLFRNFFIFESKLSGKPINFLTHPNEFINENVSQNFTRRAKGFISYILADKIRYLLKQKNLGSFGLDLYEKEIMVLIKNGFKFLTLKQYRELLIKGEFYG